MSGAEQCPTCPRVVAAGEVCPGCEPDVAAALDVCDGIADARVSPGVVRVEVAASLAAEREEIATMLDVAGHPTLARRVRARGLVRIG